MKCDTCSNYYITPDGTNEGHYTACQEMFFRGLEINNMDKKYIQSVMDGKLKYCKGYIKL